MNDLPQNELLSAYLDGELTAAEQADVERLLAADPASRQLLDELRSVGTALQSLPRQTLGEDLSRQVLRIAERRMLTEGEPGETATSPVTPASLAKSVSKRFLNRRGLIWSALAVGVAVVISVHDRYQQTPKADKELARVAAKHDNMPEEKLERESSLPPTIQAAHEPAAPSVSDKKELGDTLALAKKTTAKPKKGITSKESKEMKSSGDAGRFAESPSEAEAYDLSATRANAKLPADAIAGPSALAPRASTIAKAKSSRAAGKSEALFGFGGAKADQESAKSADESASGVLIVYCDISPDAAKNKVFDKVLSANGIVGHKYVAQRDAKPADRYKIVNDDSALFSNSVQQQASDGLVASNADVIYARATPSQVKATFDYMTSRPKVFLSVSVKQMQGESTRLALHFLAEQSGKFQGKSADKPAFASNSDMAISNASPTTNAVPSANFDWVQNSQTAGSSSTALPERQSQINQSAPASAEQQRQVGQQQNRQQLSEAQINIQQPLQQLLFVLRVSGGPPAAAEKSSSKVDADKPKP